MEFIDILKNKLKNLKELKGMPERIPCNRPVFGFPKLVVNDEKELDGRMKKLGDIILKQIA